MSVEVIRGQLETPTQISADKIENYLPIIRKAIDVLGELEEQEDIVGTARVLPSLVSPNRVEDATFKTWDKGACWRQLTDQVSHAIAIDYPEQKIRLPRQNPDENFFTDRYKLLQENGDSKIAYTSVISDLEMKDHIRLANRDDWLNFLFRITLR